MPSLLPSRRRALVCWSSLAAALLVAPATATSAPGRFRAAGGGRGPDAGRAPRRLARLWTGSGKIAYAFQWYRCDTMGARCAPLRGVTDRTRRIGPTDVGHTLSLEVRATDSNGTTAAYASLVGPIAGKPTCSP